MVLTAGAIALIMVAGYFAGTAIVNGITNLFKQPDNEKNDNDDEE